ncbi:hypothetical protein E4U54_002860 [Claviceps lovelessii]|nr:hypothetical protein E4U54_002860 [Claviceps lovelessii]
MSGWSESRFVPNLVKHSSSPESVTNLHGCTMVVASAQLMELLPMSPHTAETNGAGHSSRALSAYPSPSVVIDG